MVDARLQRAINTPKIKAQAIELIRLALKALDDLRALDESLYERFVMSRDKPNDPSASAASLQRLWDHTFSGLRQMLWLCRSLEAERTGKATPEAVSDDFDFGDFEPPSQPPGRKELELGEGYNGDFLWNECE